MFFFFHITPQKCPILGETTGLCRLFPIFNFWSTPSIFSQVTSFYCIVYAAEEEMWTGIEKLKVSYSGIWKTSTAAVLSPPTGTLNVNVWRALSKYCWNIYSSINLLFNQGNFVHEPKLRTVIRWREEQAGMLQELTGSCLQWAT